MKGLAIMQLPVAIATIIQRPVAQHCQAAAPRNPGETPSTPK